MEVESKNLIIKHNKNNHKVSTSRTTVIGLKDELQVLTNVLVPRQKLLFKGKVLGDEESLLNIPENSTLMLLGNPEKDLIVSTSSSKILFKEDLTKEDMLKIMKEKGEEYMYGLKNLGNTCYFNALIQCCGRVEPLRKALIELSKTSNNNSNLEKLFCQELGKVYESLENTTQPIVPSKLVQQLRILNPAFAENENGYYKQQDADECLGLMINIFKNSLKNNSDGEKFSDNLAEELFGISLDISMTNVEDNTEIKQSKDTTFKLVCYIDNNTTELVTGLKNSLAENVNLYSDKLCRSTVFVKKQLISRLPTYLNVQFMRFFWKQAVADMPDSKAGKAKILKSVMFSRIIDVYDLCSPEVQEVLKLGRSIENKMLKEDVNYRTDLAYVKKGENMIPTGRYQLVAVVTHQGRSSESGHYIGWTHQKDDKWTKFDDDTITPCKTQEILDLKGGGDWHMAYICIYQSLEVPFQEV